MRLVCCTGSGGKRSRLAGPGCAVLRDLAHFGCTGAGRGMGGMGSSVAAEEEELAAGGAVDGRCLRVEVVGDDGEEDPAARGGGDAA